MKITNVITKMLILSLLAAIKQKSSSLKKDGNLKEVENNVEGTTWITMNMKLNINFVYH